MSFRMWNKLNAIFIDIIADSYNSVWSSQNRITDIPKWRFDLNYIMDIE